MTLQKIEDLRYRECLFKDFTCRVFSDVNSVFRLKNESFLDPIRIYSDLHKLQNVINESQKIYPNCNNCVQKIKFFTGSIISMMNKLSIIKDFKNFEKINTNVETSKYYEYLLTQQYVFSEFNNKVNTIRIGETLLEKYDIGKENFFQISIYARERESEKNYIINYNINTLTNDIFERITEITAKNIGLLKLDQIVPLEFLIRMYENLAIKEINTHYNLLENERNKIGYYTALKKLNMEKLFPLLIDDYIEEIFLDSPHNEIYLNHQIYGRCRTDIKLNIKEIERLKTFFRLYSGKRLDYMNPSIKFVIKNSYFHCRFAIDIEPIQIDTFALDIRKLNKNVFTIQDLLKNGTINSLIAAFLYFIILRKRNITITGETDTGKTTLINALDLMAPKEFRKIYVENVTESLKQSDLGKHQLKYCVNSLEDNQSKKYSKSNIIKTLLHRTPDIIYLGEILTKEEAEAKAKAEQEALEKEKAYKKFLSDNGYVEGPDFKLINQDNKVILYKKEDPFGKLLWVPHRDKYVEEIRHFVQCVREGTNPCVTGEDGKAAVEFVEACYRSAEMKIGVDLPLKIMSSV